MAWKTNPPSKRGRWVGPGVCIGTHRGGVCGSTCTGLLWKCSHLQCKLATTEGSRGLEIQNQLLDDMKAEFQEFPVRRVYTDVEREGIPPSDADRPPVAPRAVEEEENRTSALIPTVPLVTSRPPSLPELDSESHRSFGEALQSENVLFPSDMDIDRRHRATSQSSRDQNRSMPPDVLSSEMGEHVQSARALEPVHPMNHQEPSVQKQSSEDFTPERRLSNQARERTVERADEPPTQRPRLETPASSIRWSKVDEPLHWVSYGR